MRYGYQRKMNEIFIACEMSRGYSNVRHFGSHTPTQVRHFKNHASCASYPDGQANCPTFQKKGTQRRDGRAAIDMYVAHSSMCIKHIINPVQHRKRFIRRLKNKGSVKPNSETRCMKSGLNRGV
jgi:hypothetical protein